MKISIITVVYNSVKTIEQTILNVLNQNYEDIEYIVIDGASTDGTMDVVNQYRENITYIVSEKDHGIYDAMNKGISLATGDIIAFLNSGDWYENNIIAKVADYFTENDTEILIGEANIVDNGEIISIRVNYPEEIEYSMPCCHQAVFSQRAIFQKIGTFDLSYKICADFEWLLRAYHEKVKFHWIKDILVNYDANGISENSEIECIEEGKKIVLKYAPQNVDRNRIEEMYCKRLNKAKNKIRYFEICRNKPQVVSNMLNDKSCYIWGTGNDGRLCYKLFNAAGIKVKGFIDSNKKNEILYGLKVYYPNELLEKITICIASSKYEKEIYNQAVSLGIDNELLCFFSKILNEMITIIKN